VSAPALVEEIAGLLRDAVGEDGAWQAGIGPHTRLDGDLFLDSVELAALSAALRRRYGDQVDLAGHVAGLDIDAIIDLTLAQVADLVAAHAHPAPSPAPVTDPAAGPPQAP
jgi:acyl carrier protein